MPSFEYLKIFMWLLAYAGMTAIDGFRQPENIRPIIDSI